MKTQSWRIFSIAIPCILLLALSATNWSVQASNLLGPTPYVPPAQGCNSATGIGTWNEERFLNKFLPYREEKAYNFDPGKQNTIMPWIMLGQMKESDLKAIYAYLRTIKPIQNKVEKWKAK